jgi:hypothetical protein
MLCLLSVFCGSTSRITDGGAVKCGGKYAFLAKCILQLYFTDYRWRCREVCHEVILVYQANSRFTLRITNGIAPHQAACSVLSITSRRRGIYIPTAFRKGSRYVNTSVDHPYQENHIPSAFARRMLTGYQSRMDLVW